MSNGDAWRTRSGRIGVELERKVNHGRTSIKLALRRMDGGEPYRVVWHDMERLTRVQSRYEGARGGRA